MDRYCRSIDEPGRGNAASLRRPIAVGYIRVALWAPDPLAEERAVLLQMQRVVRECSRRDWPLDELYIDRGAAAEGYNPPGLQAALDLLAQGRHQALVVAVFDRLGRGQREISALSAQADGEGWQLIITR